MMVPVYDFENTDDLLGEIDVENVMVDAGTRYPEEDGTFTYTATAGLQHGIFDAWLNEDENQLPLKVFMCERDFEEVKE